MKTVLASLAIVALLASPGCGTLGASAYRTGRASTGQLVSDQRLIDLYGVEGAVQQLVLTGTPEREARKRVLDAQIARGERGKE